MIKKYKVRSSQNLYDVALYLYGSIEGLNYLLLYNTDLSLETVLKDGMELYYDDSVVLQPSIITQFKRKHIVPSNGERHVYYKEVNLPVRFILCSRNPEQDTVSFLLAGVGEMVVDWGDNSEIEHIALSSKRQSYFHNFDNICEERVVTCYGDFSLTYFDYEKLEGFGLYVITPMRINEVRIFNNSEFRGLFLIDDLQKVEIQHAVITSLEPLYDKSISDLIIRNSWLGSVQVLDDYFIHLATHHQERRNCHVITDVAPSGVYQEPKRDSNQKYQITTGMEAIYVITHEPEWNKPAPWVFDIQGKIYQYQS